MNRTVSSICLLASVILSGCSPRVATQLQYDRLPLSDYKEVKVLEAGDVLPDDAKELGTVRISDSGFTLTKNGTYEKVLDLAMIEAGVAGGNVLKITEHQYPDSRSTIHRLNATVYSVSDTSALSSGSYAVPASSHPDYAMLHFYRPAGFNLANYNVSVDNVDVYTATYDSRAEYRIDKSGHYLISAMTEKKTFLPIEVEQGRDYYIRCSVSTGMLAGRPVLELVPTNEGEKQFQSISSSVATVQDVHELQHWKVSAGIGYGRRLGRIADGGDAAAHDYLKQLKNGLSYDMSACYFISESVGVGLKHSGYKASASGTGYMTSASGTTAYGKMSDNITIRFTGPICSIQSISADGKSIFNCNFGLGYMSYTDKAGILDEKVKLKGKTLGESIDLEYGMTMGRNLSASLQLSLTSGVLTGYDFIYENITVHESLEKDMYESLMTFSAGLKINWAF